MRNIGIDVTGRSVILAKNYRNTRQILAAGFPLVSDAWESEAKSAGLDEAKPVFSVRNGPRPAIVRCRSLEDEARFLRIEIRYLLNFEKYRPSEICILARNSAYREMACSALRNAGVHVAHYQTRIDADDWTEQEAVRVSSLHSAKGHEYAAVFIVGMVEGVFPIRGLPPADVDQERALLYVGITRARDIIYLSYSQADDAGWRLERSRFLRELAPSCDPLVFRE
jgi:superfamily I DNA/RNA helicase